MTTAPTTTAPPAGGGGGGSAEPEFVPFISGLGAEFGDSFFGEDLFEGSSLEGEFDDAIGGGVGTEAGAAVWRRGGRPSQHPRSTSRWPLRPPSRRSSRSPPPS